MAIIKLFLCLAKILETYGPYAKNFEKIIKNKIAKP
jgi:hypothetical protein